MQWNINLIHYRKNEQQQENTGEKQGKRTADKRVQVSETKFQVWYYKYVHIGVTGIYPNGNSGVKKYSNWLQNSLEGLTMDMNCQKKEYVSWDLEQ